MRIIKKQMQKNEYLMHFIYAIGDSISRSEASAFLENLMGNGIITQREKHIIESVLSEAALAVIEPESRSKVRAKLFVNAIISLMD